MGKYKGLLEDIQAKQAGGTIAEETPPPSPAPLPAVVEVVKTPTVKGKTGRPKVGKSTNPDYTQVTAYVEVTVHTAVKKALCDEKNLDFSDLVNNLLKKWVGSRT
jgi:hypothetical protein